MLRIASGIAGTALALSLLSAAASAADMPTKAPLAPVTPACTWCGWYAGVHAGYGWSDVNVSIEGEGISPATSPKGGFAGVQAGYNWMVSPNWLIGLEADLSISQVRDTVYLYEIPGIFSITDKSELEYFGTARGRIGYAQNDWLFYATGGLAWGRNEISSNMNIPGIMMLPFVDAHEYHVGWTAGAGVEWKVAPHWSVKAEYLYADLGAKDYPTIVSEVSVRHEQTLQIARLGLNYLIGGDTPAAAARMPVKARVMAGCAWCGGYFGVHAGYGWSDVSASIDGLDIPTTPSPKGGFGGVQAGYNWLMSPNWLVGLETDLSVGSIKDTATLGSFDPVALQATSDMEYFGTVRGRVGYVNNAWLVYGTGGLAWARNQVQAGINFANVFNFPIVDAHQYHVGWTAGGGVEWMVAPHWTVKAEYLYADLGAQDYSTVFSSFVPPVHHEQTLQTVKVGLNYVIGAP